MTHAIRTLTLFALAAWLGGCTIAPSPYGGPPVVDRSVRRAPPPPPPPPPVEVSTLQRPQPLEGELQPGPVVPVNPYEQPAAAAAPATGAVPPPPPAQPVQIGQEGNEAVVALLDSAATYVAEGDLDRAAAALERALRIEPRNAGIWHDLAQVRLHQRQYQQAESLASRSNGLAGDNRDLQARNWRVIAAARRAVGDTAGADAADAQAAVYSRS